MPRDYQDIPPTAFQRLPEYERQAEWIRAFLRGPLMDDLEAEPEDGEDARRAGGRRRS